MSKWDTISCIYSLKLVKSLNHITSLLTLTMHTTGEELPYLPAHRIVPALK